MSRIAAPFRLFKPGKKYWHCDFRVMRDGKRVRLRRSTKAYTRAGAADGAKAFVTYYTKLFSGIYGRDGEQGGGLVPVSFTFSEFNERNYVTWDEMKLLQEAFQQGYDARHSWRPRGRDHSKREKPANPHSAGTNANEKWQEGFAKADGEIKK